MAAVTTTYRRRRRWAALAMSWVALTALAGAFSHTATPLEASASAASEPGAPAPEERRSAPFGASCRTSVEGSVSVAYCHNPYPVSDLVRLHTECTRWWDIDGDAAPVEVGPARTVRLTGRCWKEVSSVWVTHERAPEPADPSQARTPEPADPSQARTPEPADPSQAPDRSR